MDEVERRLIYGVYSYAHRPIAKEKAAMLYPEEVHTKLLLGKF